MISSQCEACSAMQALAASSFRPTRILCCKRQLQKLYKIVYDTISTKILEQIKVDTTVIQELITSSVNKSVPILKKN